MIARAPAFLTARWLHLAMINYEVDRRVLDALVPGGTQLDLWDGRCFVSVVGFQFADTRVLGCAVPFHCNFEEVNLRFYVKRIVDGEIRRGVVFIKEIVPRRAIAWVANALYNENYMALPMSHEDVTRGGRRTVSYRWRYHGEWCRLGVTLDGRPELANERSEGAFITEHYWGTRRSGTGRRWSTRSSIRAGRFATARILSSRVTSGRCTDPRSRPFSTPSRVRASSRTDRRSSFDAGWP